MNQASPDDERVIRYLLGQLPSDEETAIEERYLADPDFNDDVRAIERELIDQYVRGDLPDRDAFEQRFLASPVRRQKVEFARAFMKLSQASTGVPGAARTSRGLHVSNRAWLAVAATLAVVVGAGLLVLNRPTQQAADHAQQAARQQPELGTEPPSTSRPGAEQPPPRQAAPLRVATLVLTPTLTRDSAETPTLTVEGIDEVRLQLQLESPDFASYQAVIRTADGDEIWRQDRLTSSRAASGETLVTVTLPASRFTTQDYTVRVSGVMADGAAEDVGGFSFRVRNPRR
jgi:hypothetical protein